MRGRDVWGVAGRAAVITALAVITGGTIPARAQTFYDATAPRYEPGTVPPKAWYYNPGLGEAGHILFDDVTTPAAVSPTFPTTLYNIKRITFGITRLPNAAAVTISPYYAQLFPDATAFGGPLDGPNYDVLSPTPITGGPLSLPANGPSLVQAQQFSFGDGVHTLFNVNGATASPDAAFRSFAVGLLFSTTDAQNGWTVALNDDNLDLLWDYVSDTHFEEFTYGNDGIGDPVIGTQWLKVEGLVLSGVPGDADVDGDVDVNDLSLLAQNWQTSGDYVHGDFDFSGFVDAADLGILATHWGQNGGGGLSAGLLASLGLPTNVPEPGSAAMLMLATLAFLPRRRRTF
jgi:hypothetical protein